MTTKSSAKFYDRLTPLYPIVDFFLRPQKIKFFSIVNRYPTGQLLEVGIGNGSNLKYYTTHEVTGVDTSQTMLAQAEMKAMRNVRLFHMSGEDLSFGDSTFDYVILSHVIAVVGNPAKLIQEVDRVLKPQGKLFILNHITPDNGLQYIDKLFHPISQLLHFKAMFHLSHLPELKKFKLLKEFDAGPFSYFKILIYEKTH